jgi:hypothetical protein
MKNNIIKEIYIEDYFFMLSMIDLGYGSKKSLLLLQVIQNKTKLQNYLKNRNLAYVDRIINQIKKNQIKTYQDCYVVICNYNRATKQIEAIKNYEFFYNESAYKMFKLAKIASRIDYNQNYELEESQPFNDYEDQMGYENQVWR